MLKDMGDSASHPHIFMLKTENIELSLNYLMYRYKCIKHNYNTCSYSPFALMQQPWKGNIKSKEHLAPS